MLTWETEELFDVLRTIVRDQGMTVILITHKLGEVMALSDRVGVMRRGKLLGIVQTADTSERELAAMMVGRDVIFDELRQGEPGTTEVLAVRGLCALDDRGLPAVRGWTSPCTRVKLSAYAAWKAMGKPS